MVVVLFIAPLSGCLTTSGDGQDKLRLATTTSIRDSGLMDVLIEDFESRTGVDVEYVAVGTGAALRLGETGDVDAVIVHSPEKEQQFVDEGFAEVRFNLAYNSYVLLSPSLPSGSVFDAFEQHVRTMLHFSRRRFWDARQRTADLATPQHDERVGGRGGR